VYGHSKVLVNHTVKAVFDPLLSRVCDNIESSAISHVQVCSVCCFAFCMLVQRSLCYFFVVLLMFKEIVNLTNING